MKQVHLLASLRGLYVIADDNPRWPHGPEEQARAALRGGACAIQLRLKHTGDQIALRLAQKIASAARAHGALLFVNDRFDLAIAAGAHGVHLGQEDLPPHALPPEVRRQLLVGFSTHSAEQVRKARDEAVDYLGFGPVFATTSKEQSYSPRGLEALREAAELAGELPVVAIGGVGAGRCTEVIAAGATAACVLSAVADAPDPDAATRSLVAEIAVSA